MRRSAFLAVAVAGLLGWTGCSSDSKGPGTGGSGGTGGAGGVAGSTGNDGGAGTGGSGGMPAWRSAVGLQGSVVRTFDGVSWAFAQPTSNDLFGVACVGNYIGWAVGQNGAVLHTSDGGQTWTVQASAVTTTLRGVRFGNLQVGWAVGDGGVIEASSDGGYHWQIQQSGTTANLNAIAVMGDGLHAFVAGDRGTLLMTADGGAHWTQLSAGTSVSLYGVAVDAGTGRGFAVGEGGTILQLALDRVTAVTSPVTTTLRSVSVPGEVPSNFAALAVGDAGTIVGLPTGESSWRSLPSNVSVNLHAALVSGDAFAAGDNGTLLQSTSPSAGFSRIDSHTTNALYGLEDL